MAQLSAVIITFNEEKRIRQTLESVKWCDEIVILDSGSTDKTTEICGEFPNCRIFTQKFQGYGAQKQKAISLSTSEWVLSIDADEVLEPALQKEITELMLSENLHKYSGYYIPRTLVFMDRIFKYGKENRRYQLRLFNKKFGNAEDNKVHEKIRLKGKTKNLKGQMLHFSFENLHDYFEKFNEYTSQLAIIMKEKNRKISKTRILFRIPLDFVKLYFVYGNFLNGYQGFVWCLLSVFYRFVKLNKYLEIKT